MYGAPGRCRALNCARVIRHPLRHKRVAQTDRRALQQQRHHQIADAVRMRERNRGDLHVVGRMSIAAASVRPSLTSADSGVSVARGRPDRPGRQLEHARRRDRKWPVV